MRVVDYSRTVTIPNDPGTSPGTATAQPTAAQPPIGQPPVGQSPVVQSPVLQPAGGQPTVVQPAAGQPTVNSPAPAQAAESAKRKLPELNSWGGFALITAVTTAIGLLEYAVVGSIGWLTGIFFVAASAFVALAIKPADMPTAVISPPIAFLVAAVLSAQPSIIGSAGNFWVLQATSVVTALAFNAPWVFGGTLVALAIVLFRRYAMGRK